MMRDPHLPPGSGLALGLDVGGTATRWALVRPGGDLAAEGEAPGFSALDLRGEGVQRVRTLLSQLGAAAREVGPIVGAHAGLTGLDGTGRDLAGVVAEALGLPEARVTLGSDVEMAFRSVLAPGEGYLVYAGTGSIAAYVDEAGALHRAGGRGVALDDGGGGYWVAREALRQVWRREDEAPGAWRHSPLALALFEALGGPEWALTRSAVYGSSRGQVGRLALAVARAAEVDPEAQALLREAGVELARLGRALIQRFGARPIVLGGRAATLHPIIREAMAEALPPGTPLDLRSCRSHEAAARMALPGGPLPVPRSSS